MVCQICGAKSGYYPLCKNCFKLKDEGKVTKCQDCGIWKEGVKPLCKECWRKNKKAELKISKGYKISDIEVEENDFRSKYPAKFRTKDGHNVRSKAELIIDNWLYHNNLVHAYERKVPLIEENIVCDFFIPKGNVWIEYWGLDNEGYLKRKELKKELYKKYDKNLIELTDKDVKNLDDYLPLKLQPYLPSNFSLD